MLNIFKRKQVDQKEIYHILKEFYRSFFSDIYNELNIGRYRQIRDAISLVINKFDSNDHPLEYTGKLVLYIQARIALKHLRLTKQQEEFMHQLTEATKYINLSYVYLAPLDSAEQFINN